MTYPTTISAFTSATTLGIANPSGSGTITVNIGSATGTLNFGGNASGQINMFSTSPNILIGIAGGIGNFRFTEILMNGVTSFQSAQSSINFFTNTSASSLTIGGVTGTQTLQGTTIAFPQATTFTCPTNSNISMFTTGTSGTFTLGSSSSGWGPIIIQAGQNVFCNAPNVTSNTQTAMNLFSSSQIITINEYLYATTLNISTSSASASTITIGNSSTANNLNLNAIVVGVSNATNTSVGLWNTYTTSIHFGGASTSIICGASTGTFQINNTITSIGQYLNTTATSAYLFNTVATTLFFAGASSTVYIGNGSSSNFTLHANTNGNVYLFDATCTNLFMGGFTTITYIGGSSYANSSSQNINFTPASQINIRSPLVLPNGASGNWTSIPLCMYGYQTMLISNTGTLRPIIGITFTVLKLGHICMISWNQQTSFTVTTAGTLIFSLTSNPEIYPATNAGFIGAGNVNVAGTNDIASFQITDGAINMYYGVNLGNFPTGSLIIGSGCITYMASLTGGGY